MGISKLGTAIAGLFRRGSADTMALCSFGWYKGNADKERVRREKGVRKWGCKPRRD
jgi:hypothetical protein